MDKKNSLPDIIKMPLTLGILALVVALLLALMVQLTTPVILSHQTAVIEDALQSLLPTATEFDGVTNPEKLLPYVTEVYRAFADEERQTEVGFAVQIEARGYAAEPIELLVGLLPDKSVIGVTVLDQSETPGIGTKAFEPDYLEQFGQADVTVSTITGATVSSSAVMEGVRQAVEQVNIYLQDAAQQNQPVVIDDAA